MVFGSLGIGVFGDGIGYIPAYPCRILPRLCKYQQGKWMGYFGVLAWLWDININSLADVYIVGTRRGIYDAELPTLFEFADF